MQKSKRGSLIGSWASTIDKYLMLAIAVAIIFSVIMVTTASPAVAERIGLPPFYFIQRQLVFLTLGSFIMLFISFLPVDLIYRFAWGGGIIFILLMVLVLFVGEEIKGAKRWISLGFIAIQPSEFIKPFFAIITASILMNRYSNPKFPAFLFATLLYLLVVGLIILQPDLGMVITISAVWGGQMFLAGLSMIWIVLLVVGALLGLLAAYTFFPHVAVRMNSFLDPDVSENYQVKKSLEAFNHGGILGTGPGEGIVKQHLPDSHTDFIFAVIGEELGMISCLLVIFLFAFIVIRGFIRVMKVGDLFAVLAVSGLLMQLGFQAIINIGVTLHLLPTKGMTLPLISYGGSSILAVSLTIGAVLALTKKRYGVRTSPHFIDIEHEKTK